MNNLGKFLRQKREKAGMSMKKLGEAVGISDSEILKIERGERKTPNWGTLIEIGNILGIHPLEIMREAGYISDKDINPECLLKNLGYLDRLDFQYLQCFIDSIANARKEELKKMTTFRLGELFCGPGGLAWGATHARISDPKYCIKHQWANDFDENTCETYRHNICPDDPDSVVCKDVHELQIEKLGDIDALAFGFPCNDFSVVGEQKGFEGTYGPLYTYGIKVLEQYKPAWFLAENVGGLTSANEGKAFRKILDDMRTAGYRVYPNLYKFEDYSIPQARHRIIIVGIRKDLPYEFKIPAPTNVIRTCKDAIENPPIPKNAPNNEITVQSARVVERLNHIKPGQNAFTAELPDDLKLNIKGAKISQIYKRLDPKRPAYTVTGSGGGGTHIYHWDEPRALTNRERARLQTFPDDYVFLGTKENVRRQIGMAVPAEGAKIIFEAILNTFAEIEYPSVPANIEE